MDNSFKLRLVVIFLSAMIVTYMVQTVNYERLFHVFSNEVGLETRSVLINDINLPLPLTLEQSEQLNKGLKGSIKNNVDPKELHVMYQFEDVAFIGLKQSNIYLVTSQNVYLLNGEQVSVLNDVIKEALKNFFVNTTIDDLLVSDIAYRNGYLHSTYYEDNGYTLVFYNRFMNTNEDLRYNVLTLTLYGEYTMEDHYFDSSFLESKTVIEGSYILNYSDVLSVYHFEDDQELISQFEDIQDEYLRVLDNYLCILTDDSHALVYDLETKKSFLSTETYEHVSFERLDGKIKIDTQSHFDINEEIFRFD